MLRITVQDGPIPGEGPVCLFLEGRIIGPWVSELERVWKAARERAGKIIPVQVVLNSVSYISQPGAALLRKMNSEGAELKASTPLTNTYLDEIRCFGSRGLMTSRMSTDQNGGRSKRIGMKRKHDSEDDHEKPHGDQEHAGPSHDQISARAYEIWIEGNRAEGKHEEHWREAEKQLRSRLKKGIST